MRKTIALALLLLVATDLASAQRRGGMGGMGRGGMGGRRGGGGEGRGGDMALTEAGEFRKLNPAGLIVDNRKKLGLNEAQASALVAMRDRSKDGNESLLAHYDSIRKEVGALIANRRGRRGEEQADSTERNGDGMQAMRTMRFLLDSLTTRREADVRAVLDYLTDEKQRREAAKLLNDQDLTFQEKLPRMGGRGRRGGGADSPPVRD
jgi:hypothetical protein